MFGSTICGFQTDLLFLFQSFVGYFRLPRWADDQKNPLNTFIQINAHTLNISCGNAHAIVQHMKRNPDLKKKNDDDDVVHECQ